MYNTNIPSDRELPPTSKLIKSTIIAAIVAIVLLVTVVMPSEYAIDPTGFGEATGLKRMGEIKSSLAEEVKADQIKSTEADSVIDEVQKTTTAEIPPTPTKNDDVSQSHEITFTLEPDEGTEVKVTMTKGAKVEYMWETDGGKSNFDVHGDSKKSNIKYHPYYKGSDVKREGVLEAAFDGGHGWFWRNRTKKSLTITIKTNGDYSDIKRY